MADGFFVPMEDYNRMVAALTEVASLRAALREKDGPTGTPQDGDLPSHTAALTATPRSLWTYDPAVDAGYLRVGEGTSTAQAEVGNVIIDIDANTGTILGYEILGVAGRLAVTSGDAGAHGPTSDQAGHSGASHQETGGPEYEQVGYIGANGDMFTLAPGSDVFPTTRPVFVRRSAPEATQEEEA